MSKAGKGDGVDAGAVGSQHPVPEDIPHLSSPINSGATGANHRGSVAGAQAGSPVKESSFLHRETSAEENTSSGEGSAGATDSTPSCASATSAPQGIPIRR